MDEFKPTNAQKKAKAAMMSALYDNPQSDITLPVANKLIRHPKLSSWWEEPGFREWFTNTQEARQKLEYLFSLALEAAEDVLLNTEPKAQSARVNMVKAIAELANKIPQRYEKTRYIDAEVQKMDRPQLEEFLARHGVKIGPRMQLVEAGREEAKTAVEDAIEAQFDPVEAK